PINVAGDNTLSFYALAWKDKSATLYVRVDGGAATSFELASNVGVANSEPYTITDVYTTSKYTMELTGLTAESVIEFSTSANFTNDSNSTSGRAVVFGVNLENAPADLPEPEYTKVTLAEATEDGVKYEVEATVAGKNNVSLLIVDATGTTLVYLGAGKTGSYTIGDTVTVQGEMETYYKLRQFKSTSLVTVKAAGTYNYPAVTEATAEMINAYDNNKAYDYVAVTGTLACEVSGSYTNYYLTVEGANGRVQVYRPLSDQETELRSLDGHNVTVTGYFVGTFKDGSTYFPNLMMLQIQDNGQAEDGGDSGDDTTGGEDSGDGDQGGTTTITYSLIDKVANLTAGTYYMAGYLESATVNKVDYDWSSYPYHVCTGVSTDLYTDNYSYVDGVLTKDPEIVTNYNPSEITLEAVEGKTNTYYVKIDEKYLYSSEYNNRKLGTTDTATEWVATDNTNGGITLTTTLDAGTISLGTGTAASKLLRSYKNESTLVYGVAFFKQN
ncbi:MAG: hypothetical protein IJX56_03095, partial [Alistipes sp.]|nr:hypothetical protein [Alistipes sp.]